MLEWQEQECCYGVLCDVKMCNYMVGSVHQVRVYPNLSRKISTSPKNEHSGISEQAEQFSNKSRTTSIYA
jgi:hypothetical protein